MSSACPIPIINPKIRNKNKSSYVKKIFFHRTDNYWRRFGLSSKSNIDLTEVDYFLNKARLVRGVGSILA